MILERLLKQSLIESTTGASLLVVSDPDSLLTTASITESSVLLEWSVLQDEDPLALRQALLRLSDAKSVKPLLVITQSPLNTLPYDLWQQGHHVDLSLHRLFPNLDYPTLRLLDAPQRQRLAEAYAAAPVRAPLGVKASQHYLLAHLFGCDAAALRRPELFPFRLSVTVDELRQHRWFVVQRQGMGIDMVRLHYG
jgi:hypothetical protein